MSDQDTPTAVTSTRSAAPRLRFRHVLADDGTRLQAWTNDLDGTLTGPTVLLCNGLGVPPWAWPSLIDPKSGVRIISWYHRGVGGSERPLRRDAVRIEDFVTDALSVLDHFGVERCVAMGWSMGVNTAFELALEAPERVSGVFAVSGVPGDTFTTMLAPLGVPRPLARAITVNVSRYLHLTGWLWSPLTTRLPIGDTAINLLSHTGFMLPVADKAAAIRTVRAFMKTPVGWYFHLALHTSEHDRIPLSKIKMPVAMVAGRWDVLAGARDMRSAAEALPDATYTELRGSHFLPLEKPATIRALLLEFLERIDS